MFRCEKHPNAGPLISCPLCRNETDAMKNEKIHQQDKEIKWLKDELRRTQSYFLEGEYPYERIKKLLKG